MIRNLEYQNQQLKKEVEELKSNFKHVDDECTRLEKQVECLLENPTQQDWDALIESDCKKGEMIDSLLDKIKALMKGDVNNARSETT